VAKDIIISKGAHTSHFFAFFILRGSRAVSKAFFAVSQLSIKARETCMWWVFVFFVGVYRVKQQEIKMREARQQAWPSSIAFCSEVLASCQNLNLGDQMKAEFDKQSLQLSLLLINISANKSSVLVGPPNKFKLQKKAAQHLNLNSLDR